MSNPQGPLQGRVYEEVIRKENPFARLLRGIGDYLPDLLQGVAAGLAAAQWGQFGGGQPIYSDSPRLQDSSYRPTPIPQVPVIQPTEIPQYTPSTVARDALRRVENQRPQVHQPSGYTGGNLLAGMVNQAASNPIHQPQYAIEQAPYTHHSSYQGGSSELLRRALEPNFGRGPSQAIPDNSPWVQNNLAYAQRPVTQAEMHAIRQQQALQVQHQQAMNAQIATSRAQRELAEMQLREMRHRQYQEAQAAQPKRLVNTRPLNESPALHQMMMRSNEARSQAQPKPLQKPTWHDKAYLNRRQDLLNKLFGGEVFNRTERQYPYDAYRGQKVDDRNISQMAAVADWILFGQQTNGQWSNEKVERLTRQLDSGEYWIPPKIERQLDLARQLNDILKRNEELDSHRNDAKALAEGMQLLIRENTLNGKVNTVQLIEDIQLFTIDSGQYEMGRLTGQAKQSNAAYNLFAGPRIGTVGWKEKYWDFGQQVDPHTGRLVNQAHHFTFFFTKGLLAGSDAATELKKGVAIGIDIPNKPDRDLGILAVDIGRKVRADKIHWRDLPQIIYEELKK